WRGLRLFSGLPGRCRTVDRLDRLRLARRGGCGARGGATLANCAILIEVLAVLRRGCPNGSEADFPHAVFPHRIRHAGEALTAQPLNKPYARSHRERKF